MNNSKLRKEWIKLHKTAKNRNLLRNNWYPNNRLKKNSKRHSINRIKREVSEWKNKFKKMNAIKNNKPNRTMKQLKKDYLKLYKKIHPNLSLNVARSWSSRYSKKQLENQVLSYELLNKKRSRSHKK